MYVESCATVSPIAFSNVPAFKPAVVLASARTAATAAARASNTCGVVALSGSSA